MSKRTFPKMRRCFVTSGVIAFLVAIVLLFAFDTGSSASHPTIDAAIFWLSMWGIFVLCMRFLHHFMRDVDAALQPIMEPQVIAGLIEQEQGYPATFEQVAAVQSMMAHRRNEAAARAAITLAMLHVAAERSKG